MSGIEDNIIRHPDHSENNKDTTAESDLILSQFNSSETQFNSRYQFFQSIASPTPLQYSQFLTLVQTIKGIQKNSKELLEIVVKCFKSIKDLTEKATEMALVTPDSKFATRERERLEISKHSNLVKVNNCPPLITC